VFFEISGELVDLQAFEDTAVDSNRHSKRPLPRVDGSLQRFRRSAAISVQVEHGNAFLSTRRLSTLHGDFDVQLTPEVVDLLLAGQMAVASALSGGGLAGSAHTYRPAACRFLFASAWHAEGPADSGLRAEPAETHSLILMAQVNSDVLVPITVPSVAQFRADPILKVGGAPVPITLSRGAISDLPAGRPAPCPATSDSS